jgi:hypothetical protein
MVAFTEADLARWGITPADEGFHRFDPADPSWNESWFWDWFTDDGMLAGHCRIGTFPSQRRFWLWLYLFRQTDAGGEWLVIEEPRLDLMDLERPALRYAQHGLYVEWFPRRPLLEGQLRAAGRARAVSGPKVGRMVDVAVDLEVTAAGVPHSTGQGDVEGHESEHYDARRFEQPIDVRGSHTLDGELIEFDGRGERDHSWGPRAWNIEWTFFAVSRPAQRLQFVEVRIKGFDGPIEVGYLQSPTDAQDLASVKLPVEAHGELADAFSGRVDVVADDGTTVGGSIELISAHEMDISHTLDPPRGTRYHRALVRVVPDEGEPLMGWLEDNRLFADDPDRPDFS